MGSCVIVVVIKVFPGQGLGHLRDDCLGHAGESENWQHFVLNNRICIVNKIFYLYFFIMSAKHLWQGWQWRLWHDNDNGYEKDDNDDDDNVGDDDNGDESGGWLMMMIVMTMKILVGQLAYTKTKAIVTNWLLIAAEMLIPKNPEKFPKDPGMKILG